ncbi:hypothetical protein AC1031_006398 [Aphanomyces cochlioides]|nr:hypothetical protein AC1031_006398 [Aphanomyces cochlioides]
MEEVWEIVLGKKVGPLLLGATLSESIAVLKVIAILRASRITSFSYIEYSEDDSFQSDIVINSPEDGLKLKFDPVSQLLTVIQVYQLNKITLRYHSNIIFGKDVNSSFLSVYQLLGPTYPGTYDPKVNVYSWHYPGGSFQFPIPPEFERLYKNRDTIPVEFPNGFTPAAIGFSIFCGDNLASPEAPQPLKSNYFEPVVVDLSNMKAIVVLFTFLTKRSIRMGYSPQDVMSELGAPSSTYYKTSLDPSECSGEYFHNYPELGLDILYSGSHAVSKIILRTNIPGFLKTTASHRLLLVVQHNIK